MKKLINKIFPEYCVGEINMESKLLLLIRQRRKYEYRTIEGYKISNSLMHHLISNDIEIESIKIGGRNKTLMRKEAKNNPFLSEKLKIGKKK